MANASLVMAFEAPQTSYAESINFLEQAIRFDPKFTLAYLQLAKGTTSFISFTILLQIGERSARAP